jgi:hypothetical protein
MEVVDEDGKTACSASGRSNGRDGLVAGWTKTSRRGKQEWRHCRARDWRDLAIATPREGFPFYTPTETQRSSQPTEVGTSGAIRRWPHRAR